MVNVNAYVCAVAAASCGLNRDQIIIAVAIAGAESKWNFTAVGDFDLPAKGCRSVGAWQINSCPDRDANSTTRFGSDPVELFDPLINARAMAAISSGGTNWAPWTTYTNGAYRDYIGTAAQAADKVDPKKAAEWSTLARLSERKDKESFGFKISTPFGDVTSASGPSALIGKAGSAVVDAANAVLDPLAALGKFFQALLNPSTWLRALGLIVGLVVLVLGIKFITNDQGVAI